MFLVWHFSFHVSSLLHFCFDISILVQRRIDKRKHGKVKHIFLFSSAYLALVLYWHTERWVRVVFFSEGSFGEKEKVNILIKAERKKRDYFRRRWGLLENMRIGNVCLGSILIEYTFLLYFRSFLAHYKRMGIKSAHVSYEASIKLQMETKASKQKKQTNRSKHFYHRR